MNKFLSLKKLVQSLILGIFYVIYILSMTIFNHVHADKNVLVLIDNDVLFLVSVLAINILLTLPAVWLIVKFTIFTYKLSSINHEVNKTDVWLTCCLIFIIELYCKLTVLLLYDLFKCQLLIVILVLPIVFVCMTSILDKSLIAYKKITAYIPLILYCLMDIAIIFMMY